MNTQAIVSDLDQEIARLTAARNLLAENSPAEAAPQRKRGRPRKVQTLTALPMAVPVPAFAPVAAAPRRRPHLSPEGRERIRIALRKRWAAKKGMTARPAKAA